MVNTHSQKTNITDGHGWYGYTVTRLAYILKLEALGEGRPPWPRHLITSILTTVCRDVVKVPSGNNVTMLCTAYVPSCQAFLAGLRRDLHVVLYASVYWHVPMDYIL